MQTFETDLIEKAKGKDAACFEQLMAPYEQRMWATCIRLMGNEQDAADMLQEAMVRIWRTLSSFAAQSSFSTWMYRVTTNVCLDALRKRKQQKDISLQSLSDESGFDPVDPGPGPEQMAERSARADAIDQALLSLSPELRAAFVLRDLQGQSYEAVASILAVSLGTAKSRIYRARVQLAKKLKGHGELFIQQDVQM